MSTGFLALSRLMSEGRSGRSTVAVERDGPRDWDDFAARVAALAAAVRDTGSGRWLLFSENGYSFAVGLLALAHAGGCAVLPPNGQPATLQRFGAAVDGILVDAENAAAVPRDRPVLHPLERRAEGSPLRVVLERNAPLVELFTSGTTGEGNRVAKALCHLDDEVATLERCFGDRLPAETQVLSTVSPQHIYGLLFRILWPLAAGRPFHAETFLLPEEVFGRMRDCPASALVTTPVHLRRMGFLPALRDVRGRCRAVFSSGGPLDAPTAVAVRDALGDAPVEVLGSTETGGVAWRAQDRPDALWSPFPPVELSSEAGTGRLVVRSPFVSAGSEPGSEPQSFVMGDRAELEEDGRFRLLGRADRIVKIGAKRLSLPEMEDRLRDHTWVEDGVLLVLEQASEARVHAVVVLTEAGRRGLRDRGRRRVTSELTDFLASDWDRILLPRLWRFVDELPRDLQGKLRVPDLRALFSGPEEATAGTKLPVLLEEQRGDGFLERRLRVPQDLVFLDGHYDGFPVVAGVVQLYWVVESARAWLGMAPRIHEIKGLKFKEMLRPEQDFRLRLDLPEPGDTLHFRLWEGTRVFSTGRCTLV